MSKILIDEATVKLALEALEKNTKHLPADFDYHFEAITAINEALAEHAMREVQRLGQEIEQEPKIKTTDQFESSMVADYNRGWNDCLFASGIVKQPEQEPKIGCVNHDCDQCKAQRTEQNFCPRCGKRTKDIHTCTPPQLEQEACKDMEKNAICSPFMISELWRLSK